MYEERPRAPVEVEAPLAVDGDCQRCTIPARRRLRNACIAPEWEGEPGGLLVVSDYPGQKEDHLGRPFVGQTGQYLRPKLKQWWQGPIALDNTVKCYPGKEGVTDEHVRACRGYLAKTIREVQPSKILVMGRTAMAGVLGRQLPPMSVRKGYGWVRVGSNDVPAYLFPNPAAALHNRFVREYLEEDLEWALTTDPPFGPVWEGEARLVETEEDAELAAADLRAAGWFAYDAETAGFMWEAFQVVCVSLCPAARDYAWAWADAGLSKPGCRRVLQELLRDRTVEKTGQNEKYDRLSAKLDLGARVRGTTDDTRLLRRLLEADADADLKTMAELVGMGGHKEEADQALVVASRAVVQVAKDNASNQLELIPTTIRGLRRDVIKSIRSGARTKTWAYGFMPRSVCIRYNALDAISTGRLKVLLTDRAEQDDPVLRRTYRRTVMPAAEAICHVEAWGVAVDRSSIHNFAAYLQHEKKLILERLHRHAWPGFNPDAYNDIRKLLFKDLGLESTAKTAGGTESTENDVLVPLRPKHPAVGGILDWRRYGKLDSTYATGMLRHIRNDGRIHGTILLDGARSGRASMRDPSLQTIPRDSDSKEGKMARDLFVAPPGWVLAQLDFSQIELREAAILSGDPVMRDLFISGEDFHMATARLIAPMVWGKSLEGKTKREAKKERSAAKALNFALLYGQGDAALAVALGCSKEEAAKVRAGVLGRFKVLDRWIKGQLAYAKKHGHCWTYWEGERARRRPLLKLADKDRYERGTAERGSYNTPIQGSASEYLTRSMTEVINWILDEGAPAKVVLPVHDSIILEIREDCVDEVVGAAHDIMTSWWSGEVPILVDVEVGPAWGSLERHQPGGAVDGLSA